MSNNSFMRYKTFSMLFLEPSHCNHNTWKSWRNKSLSLARMHEIKVFDKNLFVIFDENFYFIIYWNLEDTCSMEFIYNDIMFKDFSYPRNNANVFLRFLKIFLKSYSRHWAQFENIFVSRTSKTHEFCCQNKILET